MKSLLERETLRKIVDYKIIKWFNPEEKIPNGGRPVLMHVLNLETLEIELRSGRWESINRQFEVNHFSSFKLVNKFKSTSYKNNFKIIGWADVPEGVK